MGIYSTIKAAKATKSGQYYEAGDYKCKILAVKEVASTQKPGAMYFVVETECLESNNTNIKVGAEYSQVIDMSNIMAMPNIKVLLAAASDLDPYTMSNDDLNEALEERWSELCERKMELEQICELVAGTTNPLEGMEIGLTCVNQKTKPTLQKPEGGNFTKYQWYSLNLN